MQAFSWQVLSREIKFLASIAVISVVQTWFNCQRCHTDPRSYALISFFCFCIWVLLWRGNAWMTDYIEARIPWLKEPVKRLVVGIVTTLVYTIGIVLLMMYIFRLVFDFTFGNALQYTLIYSMVITLIVCLFLHGRAFFLNWSKVELDAEKLRNENLTARYEALKGQLDPHFLFNSLNVLTNLVYQSADQSAAFIKQLSEVYRYVLDIRSRELVSVGEEIKFVEAYVYLNRIRFGDKLRFINNVSNTDGRVPPLVIQMLVENAIKHNVISEDDPLTITVSQVNDVIVVENNLQRRGIVEQHTKGIGLDNISKRYEMLSNRTILIEETPTSFKVTIPILQIV
ncbi:sensor histidine kinase [Chryseolinea sp. T2]|uniref:sensor histidine kinase n=1 Tax=Chryseolinea sp. T2 TaxID=3129255 RepID=UPI0030788DB2